MKIKDILKAKDSTLWTVKATQSIQEAVHLLSSHQIGVLLVTDATQESVVGTISERDIIRGCEMAWKPLTSIRVQDWMARELVTCSPEDDIREIMAVMTHRRIRHLPVTHQGEIEGILSIGDVVKGLLEDSETQVQYLRDYAFGSLQRWMD